MSAAALTGVSLTAPAVRHSGKQLGNPAPLACTVAKAVVEAILGGPDLTPVHRWLEPELRKKLERQRSLAKRAGQTGGQVRVLRSRVDRIDAFTSEVAIVVATPARTRAVAMRMEVAHGRWITTLLDLI
ncbi:Rv3235 family protein [Demequina globuliformis]|uniref:Rv3235 family protein n=1 Tax=Demequina globuliformis TaxID=676202 RepID=UPI000A4EA888|nr:Rv3235 family protein [Demequina globuliformis]